MRWNAVFLPAKDVFAFTAVDALSVLAVVPLAPWAAAFSRSAASFWALGPRPFSLGLPDFGMKLLMRDIISWIGARISAPLS